MPSDNLIIGPNATILRERCPLIKKGVRPRNQFLSCITTSFCPFLKAYRCWISEQEPTSFFFFCFFCFKVRFAEVCLIKFMRKIHHFSGVTAGRVQLFPRGVKPWNESVEPDWPVFKHVTNARLHTTSSFRL